ncbi:uncharacterized protein LOC132716451 isoform X1 [Ruditapes philippinarum]|uniref:uncharacterized protein LOC132716451 isoform X1 n=1 Tax=Ruditapes philippinarum TaxID=129788 RepID=UPI00295B626E|nr:uncharacterized protein LOC132716451 isoform X1 [Ruditapes philippinarum]
MAFATASTLIKVVLVLAMIGFVLDVIGFATPYWMSYSGYDVHRRHVSVNGGLWRSCHEGYSYISRRSSYYDQCYKAAGPGWFEATQAFETLGFIAAIVALVLIVLYVFVPQTSGKKIVFILAMLACFAAAGCIILGIIIYGSKMDNLSWSFALCCIAGIIFGISGILLVVDMLKR